MLARHSSPRGLFRRRTFAWWQVWSGAPVGHVEAHVLPPFGEGEVAIGEATEARGPAVGVDVPQPHRLVPARRGQQLAVRAETPQLRPPAFSRPARGI